jgi:hypothetical protein
MHAFDHRLNQLLDRVANVSPGRRQRLARSLRQDDVELGVRAANPTLDAAMKASLRVAAHEVLDTFCMHLEGALARCRGEETRMLLMAVVAIALADHDCVLFEHDGQVSGVEFPAAHTWVVSASPASRVDLRLELRRHRAAVDTSRADCRHVLCVSVADPAHEGDTETGVVVAPQAIVDDPFSQAAMLLGRLRAMASSDAE